MNRLQAAIAAGALGALACGAFGLLLADDAPSSAGSAAGGALLVADGGPQLTLRPGHAQTAAALSPELLEAPTATQALDARGAPLGGPSSTRVGQARARGAQRSSAPRARGQRGSAPAEAAGSGERIQTRVRGHVVDERGYPLPGVQVASLGPAARAVTDDEGAFELLLDRDAGPQSAGLVIQARAAGFETADQVLVSQEPELELELELVRQLEESALSVCVLDAYGQRVSNQRVFVTPDGAVDTFSSPTLDDGTCRLTSLSPGPVLVWLREGETSEPTLQQRLELQPGENQLDLRLGSQ